MKNIYSILSRQSHPAVYRRLSLIMSQSPPISPNTSATTAPFANDTASNNPNQITKSAMIDMFQHGPSASDFARTYNDRTGGCNIRLATQLIALVKPHLPPAMTTSSSSAAAAEPLRIIDNACGPLVLTDAILHDEDIGA